MDNYFEYIQDYLDGILLPEDRQRFEEELVRNADLRMETDHQRTLQKILTKQLQANDQLPALLATLQTANNAHFAKVRKRKPSTIVRWLIPLAAAACLLLIFNIPGWWAINYETLPDMPVSVTRGADSENISRQAAEAFNAKAYTQSIPLLQTLIAEDTTVIRNRYYLGLSYLGIKDYQQSAATLQPIADGTAVYADDACYFLAVALWRLGKPDEALHYAKRVTPQSDYHRKAEKLADRFMQ